MLKRGGDVDWWILNENDGSSGVIDYTDAQDGTYDWVGVDTNDVDYVHPWAWVQKGDNIIKHLQELAQACAARVFRVDSSGVLTMTCCPTGFLSCGLDGRERYASITSACAADSAADGGRYIWPLR
jgi:hypothetical protein